MTVDAFTQQPIVSLPGQDMNLALPGSDVFHRAKSSDTQAVFAVVEFITQPGKGASLHVHEREDELVYVVEGEIEVTLGEQKMVATQGVMALLPRGIPHAFTNIGTTPSRFIDIMLPGAFDNYFVELHTLYNTGEPDEASQTVLAEKYGIRYL
jgi:quercetin dioxygenase-like cupin family protein